MDDRRKSRQKTWQNLPNGCSLFSSPASTVTLRPSAARPPRPNACPSRQNTAPRSRGRRRNRRGKFKEPLKPHFYIKFSFSLFLQVERTMCLPFQLSQQQVEAFSQQNGCGGGGGTGPGGFQVKANIESQGLNALKRRPLSLRQSDTTVASYLALEAEVGTPRPPFTTTTSIKRDHLVTRDRLEDTQGLVPPDWDRATPLRDQQQQATLPPGSPPPPPGPGTLPQGSQPRH